MQKSSNYILPQIKVLLKLFLELPEVKFQFQNLLSGGEKVELAGPKNTGRAGNGWQDNSYFLSKSKY